MPKKIVVAPVPLCEMVFEAQDGKKVTKLVDFDRLVRLFRAVDETYPSDPEDPQKDFDVVGARVAAYGEIVEALSSCGPGEEPVPPQGEGSLLSLRRQIYDLYLEEFGQTQKKTAAATPTPAGSGNSNSGPSPSGPSSAATPPAGPPGGRTSPGTSSPGSPPSAASTGNSPPG